MPIVLSLLLILWAGNAFCADLIPITPQIYTRVTVLPLSLFSPVRFPADRTLTISQSRFVPNRELCELFTAAGLRDFSLSGKGTSVILVGELTGPKTILERIQSGFPEIAIIRSEGIPSGDFFLSDLRTVRQSDRIDCTLRGIAFRGAFGSETNFAVTVWIQPPKSEPDPVVEENSARDVQLEQGGLTARSLGGMQAELTYRKDGLEITTRCQIVRRISGKQVLIKNLRSGKTMIVPLEWEEE